ncbi:MAG: biotin--[acetyl-CoA-carboxylase] ligase [Verrucomicrobiaceae bacterium]|nr:biotin--[acetyl-CoA-carboxylase] ligase [Verrucomicrobiaceae bacterium]
MNEHPPLNHAEIEQHATREGLPWKILCLDNCQSTNRETVTRINKDPQLLQSGIALFSEWQESGRGRRGARWLSPRSRNLLLSVALPPPVAPEHWARLTHAAALAVYQTLRTDFPVTIKWPNDIYLANAKVAGILIESITPSVSADQGMAVIGIGLNINSTPEDFPEHLDSPATSLRMHCTPQDPLLPREPIAVALLCSLHRMVLRCINDFATMVDELKAASALLGHKVTLQLPDGQTRTGLAKDYGSEGELLLQVEGTSASAPLLRIASADHVRRN